MSIEEERLIERVQPEVSLCEEPPVVQPQEPASVNVKYLAYHYYMILFNVYFSPF